MHFNTSPERKREIPEIAKNLAGKENIDILFVCLGNICRSPAAEGVLRAMAEEEGVADRLNIDSAGLYGGHAGEMPDKRMRVHAFQRGYSLIHRSRPVRISDYDDFDMIVAMDDSNYDRLRGFVPTLHDKEKVVKMIDFVKSFPQCDCVPDPYYDGAEGFELVLDLLEDGCKTILDVLFK